MLREVFEIETEGSDFILLKADRSDIVALIYKLLVELEGKDDNLVIEFRGDIVWRRNEDTGIQEIPLSALIHQYNSYVQSLT